MTPSTLLVEAEGFVFATVINSVEITAPTTKDDKKVTVTRVWKVAPSFRCNIDPKNFSPEEKAHEEMPKVSNEVRARAQTTRTSFVICETC
jgi:hypothetical protein